MTDMFRDCGGALHCENVDLRSIAEKVGTPTYVYSAATIRNRFDQFRQASASCPDAIVAYAVKANPNVGVLSELARAGAGADVVSAGEYIRARQAGIAGDLIVFSGVGKTAEEMAVALKGGIFQFNLESIEEADLLSSVAASLGMVAPVAIRVNPDIEAGTHDKISTGAASSKFGIAFDQALQACEHVSRLPHLRLQGVAVHIGSQLTSLDPLEAAFRKLGVVIEKVRGAGFAIEVADLGGGLGVVYDPRAATPPAATDYAQMATAITKGWDVRLVFEPGRFIVADAGVLVTRIIRIKDASPHPFIIVDAGMNDFARPSLYDAWHRIDAVNPRAELVDAHIVGPVCENSDVFARARRIPRSEPGDLLAIRGCGAYAATMASTYNSRPLAAEVLVDGALYTVVRKRQSIDEMIASEARRNG